MGADYKKQYRPDQLEPFWPNEIIKMVVVVLCTLAVIMFFAVLPVLLDMIGVHGAMHGEEPANPQGATPAGIKPEWYFLAVYQYLRLMPTELFGISGKTLGVLSQGVGIAAVVLLPFWYRRRASRRPGWVYRLIVTAGLVGFLVLTIWGGWPETQGPDGGEELIPFKDYLHQKPTMFILFGVALVVFYFLIWRERRMIRQVLDAPDPGEGAAP
ncbi:MAG: Cytochrome b6-f complex subunit 4 [Phycisphaerae bacterium]|nr:Cytochrome b6-f complex subunit 4 [Phycisphaerae bacterium]